MSRLTIKVSRIKKLSAALMLGTALQFGGCTLDEFSTTSAVTLNTRDVVNFLVQSWILTPIQTAISNGVDQFFDVDDAGQ